MFAARAMRPTDIQESTKETTMTEEDVFILAD